MKGWFFVILGAALLVGAIVASLGVRRFVDGAVASPGQVTRLNAGGSHPEIAFVARNGERVSFSQGGWITGYKVGDRVRVLHDPAAPRRGATVDALGTLWAWPIALAVFGIGFLIGGGLELIGSRR